jgi:hypothetical protein
LAAAEHSDQGDHGEYADRPGPGAVAQTMRRIAADPNQAMSYEAELYTYTIDLLLDGAQAPLDTILTP